ncbi:cytochrome P450 [Cryomyces antarcticus]
MAVSNLLDELPLTTHPISVFLATATLLLLTTYVYRAFFHPLSRIPGPLLPRVTSLWLYYHSYRGTECTAIHRLHQQYGSVVRVAPNEVDISDGAGLAPVYTGRGGFLKARCYENFDIDGHPSIFSALDPAHRASRAKPVVPMFATSAIRARSDILYGCVDRMVARMQAESKSGKPVNILNLSRSLAVDVVSAYLFGKDYGGVSEESKELSASQFVNAFVAVGRFFYLPNTVFVALELPSAKFWPSREVDESMAAIEDFVGKLVDEACEEDGTYQARMLKAGISKHETAAQCKDLVFAGTDSTGMNLSTICWHLAQQPERYTQLRQEILSNPSTDPQTLPYLTAVIKEGLRVSMANPTRLPRVVPAAGGWSFADYWFPPGTVVGAQIYSLHHNPSVFSSPYAFRPERWLGSGVDKAMLRDHMPFGLGHRQCIARNLATAELFVAVQRLIQADALRDARPVAEKIEILQWFNSKVVDEKIELVWDL